MSECVDAVSSPKFIADGKAALIGWLTCAALDGKADTCLTDSMRIVAAGAGDKSGDVRDAVGRLVMALAQVGAATASLHRLIIIIVIIHVRH